MSVANVPFKLPRLVSLFLSFVFGVIGLAFGADAFVKSNNQKASILRAVPQGATVNIDTHDVVDAGAVVTAFCAAIAAVSLVSLVLLLFSSSVAKREVPLSTRTLGLQGGLLSFSTIGLFASLVAMSVFVANRQAKVTASIGDLVLPSSFVQSVEKSLGATSVYHEIRYLRLAVILAWIALLFGVISSVLALAGASRARRYAGTSDVASDSTSAGFANEKTSRKGHGAVNAEQAHA